MRVAITGANGFLGSYLVRKCLNSNFQVIALVRKGANYKWLPTANPQLSIHIIDYSADLSSQLSEMKKEVGLFDFVIHNAGLTVSLDKEEYFTVNTELTKKLIDSIVESDFFSQKGKFIYVSSYAAHGPSGINKPVSYYGESKKQAEEYIVNSAINHLIFRPTAVYGAGDHAFLPLFKAAQKGIYPATNPRQKMSMIHGSDLANMIVEEMQNSKGVIFVNDGNTYLHQDFINTLEEVLNRKIKKIPIPDFLSKISLMISDIWNRFIGNRPGITLEKFEEISQDWNLHEDGISHCQIPAKFSLKDGFEDAYQFYKKNKLL